MGGDHGPQALIEGAALGLQANAAIRDLTGVCLFDERGTTVIRPDRWCGLATLPLFADRPDVVPSRDGAMQPPPGAGLGDVLAEWYGA